MESDNFIIINGQKYDKTTGKLISDSPSSQKTTNIVNSNPKKAPIINKSPVKKTTRPNLTRKPGNRMDISRSKKITHFQTKKPITKPSLDELEKVPSKHPVVLSSERKRALKKNKKISAKTAKEIKEQAIKSALEKPKKIQKEKNFFGRHAKAIFIFSIIFIAISTIYFTYTNIPIFSVKVAGTQAGINASFPNYYPDGYSTNGPVTYNNNQVLIKFKSNNDTTVFEISQARSTWDSSAVKDMVKEISNGIFQTTEERGLTIYSYNGNAAWVNGGILYKIDGNALLSSYQIRKIATSL